MNIISKVIERNIESLVLSEQEYNKFASEEFQYRYIQKYCVVTEAEEFFNRNEAVNTENTLFVTLDGLQGFILVDTDSAQELKDYILLLLE